MLAHVELVLVAALGVLVVHDLEIDTILGVIHITLLRLAAGLVLVEFLQADDLAHQGARGAHDANRRKRTAVRILDTSFLLFTGHADLARRRVLNRANDHVEQVERVAAGLVNFAVRALGTLDRLVGCGIVGQAELGNTNFTLRLGSNDVYPVLLDGNHVGVEQTDGQPLLAQGDHFEDVLDTLIVAPSARFGFTEFQLTLLLLVVVQHPCLSEDNLADVSWF